MKREIRYCRDRRCDKTMSEMFDPRTPICFNDDSAGTTYCDTQLTIFGCPRGFEL